MASSELYLSNGRKFFLYFLIMGLIQQKMQTSGSLQIQGKGYNLSGLHRYIAVISENKNGLWSALEFEILHNPGLQFKFVSSSSLF